MHELLARAYHLALRILLTPLWRPPVAAFIAGLLGRLLGAPRAGIAACLALCAGWAALVLPGSLYPAAPLARLAGAALLLLGFIAVAPRAGKRTAWLAAPVYAVLQGWWLRGAPVDGAGIANAVPVFLGIWAAAAVVRRISARDTGWTTIAASLALAGSLYFSGGATHWARAAVVPASAGVALLGMPLAVPALAQGVVLAAIAAIVASDRGRFVPVDAAALAPLLVWLAAPLLLPRLQRAGPALAAALAAVAAIAAAAAAARIMAYS